ncbi:MULTISPECIES: universal stress protein [Chitinophagaceae]|uniref:universal stress protein n=1 Tax=Chitinophagaceae TaxID=563835 RepID=UPI000DEF92CB|nr:MULTISPECIES: universal stress protein [Chitinophagaceae]RPD51595.1 universal stress protein [Paracnuella aquatica]
MTIIVPTDFSATANNAANYAVRMLHGTYDNTLILYHVYDKAADEADAQANMDLLKSEMQSQGAVKIETRCELNSDFINSLERLARHFSAGLVVMGITGKSRLEQVFFGSNTLKMVERNVCPVLIVPPAAQFTKVTNVALTSDFHDVRHSIPHVPIKRTLELFRPSLHIVNVNSEHYVSLTEEYLEQRGLLVEMFREFNPEFYFIGTYNVEETIQTFVMDKNIDMLITVPRQRNLFASFYKTSTTRKLAYESTVPILAAHE